MIASKIYWLKQRITKLISHLTKWHLCQSNVKNEEEKKYQYWNPLESI